MMNKFFVDDTVNEDCKRQALGIYLHFPFCRRKCDYCDFYSVVPSKPWQIEEYVRALIGNVSEICSADVEDYLVDSIFFGGGTPSLLSPGQMNRIIVALSQKFRLSGDCEITLESNPATLTPDSLCQYRRAGVNRLSIGLQSANEGELCELSRIHTPKDFLLAFHQAREAGFDNINIDLMYGIPGQTFDSFMRSLDFAVGLNPEHLSVYGLRIEAGTPLGARDPSTYVLPSEEVECRMYLACVDSLKKLGYNHYEISNFSKPGRECRHNSKYWNCEPYIGLGTSAHSYFNNVRYSYVSDIEVYCAGILSGLPHSELMAEYSEITPDDREREYIMLRLRLSEGICVRRFAKLFGRDFERIYAPRLAPYIKEGLVYLSGSRYALTPDGMLVSNSILCDLIDF
ncbi:MAG: radical SAM family heme chaperone HemW [Clostridiales bacterium]|nr:radical SAM family heme chaperone HemW [Clostridiales bacterium]